MEEQVGGAFHQSWGVGKASRGMDFFSNVVRILGMISSMTQEILLKENMTMNEHAKTIQKLLEKESLTPQQEMVDGVAACFLPPTVRLWSVVWEPLPM